MARLRAHVDQRALAVSNRRLAVPRKFQSAPLRQYVRALQQLAAIRPGSYFPHLSLTAMHPPDVLIAVTALSVRLRNVECRLKLPMNPRGPTVRIAVVWLVPRLTALALLSILVPLAGYRANHVTIRLPGQGTMLVHGSRNVIADAEAMFLFAT